jgi:hypothetical protein
MDVACAAAYGTDDRSSRSPSAPSSISRPESFGFTTTSEPYDDFGVAHVEITLWPRG